MNLEASEEPGGPVSGPDPLLIPFKALVCIPPPTPCRGIPHGAFVSLPCVSSVLGPEQKGEQERRGNFLEVSGVLEKQSK